MDIMKLMYVVEGQKKELAELHKKVSGGESGATSAPARDNPSCFGWSGDKDNKDKGHKKPRSHGSLFDGATAPKAGVSTGAPLQKLGRSMSFYDMT